MKIICVIPARLASQRFPRKVLALLGDKPLLQWIWEGAVTSQWFDEIIFAVDHHETAQLIRSFGGAYQMTSVKIQSGTDRLVELRQKRIVSADIWVNWQGDHPFIHREMIDHLLQSTDQDCDIWSLRKKIQRQEEIDDPHTVKVVTDPQGRALYFSRAPIPYYRDRSDTISYYKHIGIYAYTDQALQQIHLLPASSPLEQTERLEQLRFLEHRFTIQVHETPYEAISIDTPQDLKWATDHIPSHSFHHSTFFNR